MLKSRWGMAAAVVVFLLSSNTFADPPPGPIDPALHAWFERQKNMNGDTCCDLSDGHIISDDDVRIVNGHYEINIEGSWYSFMDYAMRGNALNDPNPTGHPIVWYRNMGGFDGGIVIYCFAPGTSG